MSHLVKATCEIDNFDILERVCIELGYKYKISAERGGRFILPHAWHDLIFYLDGRVERDSDDTRLGRIKQAYAEMKLTDLAYLSGMSVERSEHKNGTVVLEFSKMEGGGGEVISATVGGDGNVVVEADGFKGSGCKAATRFLTEALNVQSDEEKSEYYDITTGNDVAVENHSL